jgi:hypothetical protein
VYGALVRSSMSVVTLRLLSDLSALSETVGGDLIRKIHVRIKWVSSVDEISGGLRQTRLRFGSRLFSRSLSGLKVGLRSESKLGAAAILHQDYDVSRAAVGVM